MAERNIYGVVDIAPETQAYALARYSRSASSLKDSVAWINNQKAADFLDTFYFAYGHKSIADMAHVTLALENISVLAAIAVEDEPLWDGQERSTRYQDFTKSGYVTPTELDASVDETIRYQEAATNLFNTYTELTKSLFTKLAEALPKPDDMEAGAYRRTLNARVLDVTRTLLPYATRTSVGQITSARVLERQLSRLLASGYQEIREVAEEMKAACRRPGFSLQAARFEEALKSQLEQHPEAAEMLAELGQIVSPTVPAPTLVKYAMPSEQGSQVAQLLAPVVKEYLGHIAPDNATSVQLADPDPSLIETVVTLLYRYSDLSYGQIQAVVRDMSPKVRLEIYDLAHSARGRHDDWLREQHGGYGRIYDMLLDAKAMQDFFRHRRCVQIRQEITASHGFVNGAEWFKQGLPAQAANSAIEAGLADRYDQTMQTAQTEVAALASYSEAVSHYLLPLGYKRRALFKMDDAQAAYIIETRSGVNGHFAYRAAAYQMWQELERVQPEVARWVRVTPPDTTDYLKR